MFFVVGAFLAWREQYVNNLKRPVELREKLDAYMRHGERLFNAWMDEGGSSVRCIVAFRRLRSRTWAANVVRFVRQNFSMKHYDEFKTHMGDIGPRFDIALRHKERGAAFETASLVSERLQALQSLRPQIRDAL